MTKVHLSVGLFVRHKRWGLGKVIHLNLDYVWVYFKDIEGPMKAAVKQLSRRIPVLTQAERQSDSALDNLPPIMKDGKLALRDTLRITKQQAVDMFVKTYRHFDDPEYLKTERDYKWDAHRQVAEKLLSSSGRDLVAAGQSDLLAKTLRKLIQQTNLLAVYEMIALNDAINPHFSVRRGKALFLSGCESHPATVAPAGSSRSGS